LHPRLHSRHRPRPRAFGGLAHLRRGGGNETFNCGYGHGSSVLEVIEAVKRASGRDFAVRLSARRPGDPATIVADGQRLRTQLGWTPQFDDLDTIVEHALAWERRLAETRETAVARSRQG
jgi:UDP-glucose 4-epimerase